MANEKRLIDANGAVEYCRNRWGMNTMTEKFLNAQPTVDAVEVVRCKECKFAYINNFAKVQEKALCNRWRNHDGNSVLLKADDFCSYGERREGE